MHSQWGQCCAGAMSYGQPRVEAGDVARNTSNRSGEVVFFGAKELRGGRYEAQFKILSSRGNNGAGINIGLVDASVSVEAGDCDRDVAWSFYPYSGKLWTSKDPVGRGLPESNAKQLGPDLQGKANGATVEVTVDMTARRVLVSVNGGESVDAGVELPAAVRLWCSLYCADDAVQLVSLVDSAADDATCATPTTFVKPNASPPPPSAKMPSLWGQCASAKSDGQPRVEACDVARNASKGVGEVVFLGAKELWFGQHEAHFKIVKSRYNDGAGMRIGVVDASVAATTGDRGRYVAWAFAPFTGELWTFTDPVGDGQYGDCGVRGGRGREGKKLGKHLQRNANGATVQVTVDMDARRMLVSVNGERAVGAGVELPAAVRLWCRLSWPDDAVQLVWMSSSGGGARGGGGRGVYLESLRGKLP